MLHVHDDSVVSQQPSLWNSSDRLTSGDSSGCLELWTSVPLSLPSFPLPLGPELFFPLWHTVLMLLVPTSCLQSLLLQCFSDRAKPLLLLQEGLQREALLVLELYPVVCCGPGLWLWVSHCGSAQPSSPSETQVPLTLSLCSLCIFI